MSLRQKQSNFVWMVLDLLQWGKDHGYEFTLAEAFRSDEQAEINAIGYSGRQRVASLIESEFPDLSEKILNNGKANGIRHSIHQERLAIDLNVFKDGQWLSQTEQLRELGERWESKGGAWGGRFRDGNHFSLEHNGIK